MIASTAALLAIMASLVAGENFVVLPKVVSRDQAIAACVQNGQQLAELTSANINQVAALLGPKASGWIKSWNGDSYGNACLRLLESSITTAPCGELFHPVCEGAVHPHPAPCPSSSSSSSCSSSSSSSSCTTEPSSCSSSSSSSCTTEPSTCSDSSSTSWCSDSSSTSSCPSSSSSTSWCSESSSTSECDVSSSFSCSTSVDSSICETSSSSSSSRKCDPCCAGVRKLTYQAPFGPGIYLAKVTQRFTVFDVFGPNACTNVAQLGATLGVTVTLVASNGTNACDSTDETPYGAWYVVSRAWALNQPIYALWNGTVYAANSLYNCYGEYRAILITKPLSELTFVTNSNGDVCFERCRGKPRSCVALCQADFARPNYLNSFKMGN